MRIVFATDTYFPASTGTASFLFHITKKLRERGHEVHILAPALSVRGEIYEDENGTFIHGIRSMRVPIYPDLRLPIPVAMRNNIRKHIKQIAPDLIHIQHHFPIGRASFIVGRELGIPVIGTNHFMPGNLIHYFPIPKALHSRVEKFAWKQMMDVYEQLEEVTTPTSIAADVLRDVGFKKPVLALSNGVDVSRFQVYGDLAAVRAKYKIPKKKILLTIGRLDREKRLDLMIEAMPQILKSVDVQLVISGKGALAVKLKEQAKQLGVEKNVTFTGFIKDADMTTVLKLGDVFVAAGEAELQCISVLEAMAAGLPVVAADAVALPLLVEDGVNGYLFEMGNWSQLAQRVVDIFLNEAKRKRMAAASLRLIKRHDVTKVAGEYEKIYRRVIAKRKKMPIVKAKKQIPYLGLGLSVVAILISVFSYVAVFNTSSRIRLAEERLEAKLDKVTTMRNIGVEKVKSSIVRLERSLK